MSAVPSRVREEVFPTNPSADQTNEEVFSFNRTHIHGVLQVFLPIWNTHPFQASSGEVSSPTAYIIAQVFLVFPFLP